MEHDIEIKGKAFCLRPVNNKDAKFILSLRNNPKLNKYIGPTSPKIEDQINWLNNYYHRENDYYFVIENQKNKAPEGLISIYKINKKHLYGEWGRWIIRPGSLSAVESVWMMYRCAFEILNLKEVFCITVAENRSVVSFHDSVGFTNRKLIPSFFNTTNKIIDGIEHRINKKDWYKLEVKINKLSFFMAKKLNYV